MDFSSYYYYIPLNFYETPEMTLIDHEPNGDSATVLVLALAKIHTRTVTKNDDGTFTIVTDDGTLRIPKLWICSPPSATGRITPSTLMPSRLSRGSHPSTTSPTPKPNAIRRPRRCTDEAPRSVAQGLQ